MCFKELNWWSNMLMSDERNHNNSSKIRLLVTHIYQWTKYHGKSQKPHDVINEDNSNNDVIVSLKSNYSNVNDIES